MELDPYNTDSPITGEYSSTSFRVMRDVSSNDDAAIIFCSVRLSSCSSKRLKVFLLRFPGRQTLPFSYLSYTIHYPLVSFYSATTNTPFSHHPSSKSCFWGMILCPCLVQFVGMMDLWFGSEAVEGGGSWKLRRIMCSESCVCRLLN